MSDQSHRHAHSWHGNRHRVEARDEFMGYRLGVPHCLIYVGQPEEDRQRARAARPDKHLAMSRKQTGKKTALYVRHLVEDAYVQSQLCDARGALGNAYLRLA